MTPLNIVDQAEGEIHSARDDPSRLDGSVIGAQSNSFACSGAHKSP